MFEEEHLDVAESPAKEVARRQAFTDKTSRLAFYLECELRERYEPLIRQFLIQDPFEVVSAANLSFGRTRTLNWVPLKDGRGVYGYYAPPEIKLPQWVYEQEGFGEDYTDCPRLLITTSICERDFAGLNDSQEQLEIVERNFKEIARRQELGVPNERYEVVRHIYRPLTLLVTLYSSGEIMCSWADIEALGSKSFAPRLLALRHSVNVLFEGDRSLAGRILRRIDMHEEPTEFQIFLDRDRQ